MYLNLTITKRVLLLISTIGIISASAFTANAQTNQTVSSGQATSAVNFPGSGCVFNWVNSNPSVGLPASGVNSIASFVGTNNGSSPIVATITATPVPARYAYIANYFDGTVSVLNTLTNTVVSTITVGTEPYSVSESPDGSRVYVGNIFDETVSVINTLTGSVVATVNNVYVEGLVTSPDGSRVYVANINGGGTISVINTSTNVVVATIPLVSSPYGVAVSPDGKWLYAANINSGAVSVINTQTDQVLTTIAVGGNPNSIAVSPDGSKVYVTNGGGFGFISVINAQTNSIISTIVSGTDPEYIAISPDGSRLYVTASGSNRVLVINTANNSIVTTINVAGSASGISITPDGSTVYVANGYVGSGGGTNSNTVSIINTATNTVSGAIQVGSHPISFGNFVSNTLSCNSSPITFTITINPASATPPVITTGSVSGTITACAGSPSASPNIQQFTVSGTNLTGNVAATAPAGFEVSLTAGGGYGSSATLTQTTGTVNSVVVYVRSAASAPTGNISGNVVLSSAGATSQNVAVSGKVNALPTINPVSDQAVLNAALTTAVNFTGTGDTFTWVNDTPAIGLPASGTGNIAPFATINYTVSSIIATITVTPSATGTGCSGAPIKFTITVAPDPYATTALITTGSATGTISACVGSASASPNIQQFTVSGSGLTSNITATAPTGFEVSLAAGSGFGGSVTLAQSGGTLNSTIVYVRSSSSAPAGNISGNVVLTAIGATSQNVMVAGTVNALPTVNAMANQTVANGAATTAINFTGTGNTFTWVNDSPGIGLPASGSGNIASFTAINTKSSAVTATIKVTPVDAGLAYVPHSIDGIVSVINIATNTIVANITVGTQPWGVSVSPDGSRVYVTNELSRSVSVINTSNNSIISTINVDSEPYGIAVSPDGSRVYVANQNSSSVSVINAATNTVIADIVNIGTDPYGIAVSPDGSTVYVSTNSGYISVINAATNTVASTITADPFTEGILVSPDGSRLYATNAQSEIVSVINTKTNKVINKISVGFAPLGLSESPDGSRIYVTNNGGNNVSIINTVTQSVIATVNVGEAPDGISVSPDGTKVYVANNISNDISVINTATNTVMHTIPVATNPIAFGNFISGGTECTGAPITFTITVNPTMPTITASAATGTISACAGTVSASPQIQQFLVSGSDLTGNIIATAPIGFEISLAVGSGYANSVTITQSSGAANNTVVYVRSAASASPGNITGSVTLTSTGATTQSVVVTGTINALPTVNKISNQTVANGGVTSVINFTGTGDTFTWTNDTPTIGLPASGVGNITSFSTINNNNVPVIATITVTPSTTGIDCSGTPITFTITVNPSPSGITVGGHLSALNTVYGTPSSAEGFTIAGTNLNTGILITAPLGFEVSADGDTFAHSVNIDASGTLTTTTIYIRLASTTPVGHYAGDIVLTSAGTSPVNVPMPNSTVNPAVVTVTPNNTTRYYGDDNPIFSVTYTGFVNQEDQTQLTTLPLITTTATVASPPGPYLISASGAKANNYIFDYLPGTLTVVMQLQPIIVPNVFTPNNDRINDTWDIQSLAAYPNSTVNVFNRWGQRVYFSNGYPTPWNGQCNGADLPAGTYYYVIDPKNGYQIMAGYVVILR